METLKSLLGFDCQSTVVVIPNKDLHSVLPHCFRRGLFTYAIGGICVLNCFFVCLFVFFFWLLLLLLLFQSWTFLNGRNELVQQVA